MGITRALALTVAAVATAATAATGAHASAPGGSITSPTAGTPATVGASITVTATSDGMCAPALKVRTPAGDMREIATGKPDPMCGPVTFGGSYLPDAPGKHAFYLVNPAGDVKAEVEVTAVIPPAPTVTATVTATPAVTVTEQAKEAAQPSPSPTATPTVTVTATPTPSATPTAKASPTKAKPKPTVTKTVQVTTTAPAPQPAPQVQQIPALPQDEPTQEETPPAPPAPVQTAAAPAGGDQMPAWLAYQLTRQQEDAGPGFGTVVGAVITVLAPIALIAGAAWWLIYRRRTRHNHR
ncbi:hypothetical protein [Nonomuraea sp. NPDC003214]